jgi:hypothetical protein
MDPTTSEVNSTIDPHQPLPETVHLTSAVIRGWRDAGYRINEEHIAPWLYLHARSSLDSALYKVVGPCFRGGSTSYLGIRVA